jgi:hypothetical protein
MKVIKKIKNFLKKMIQDKKAQLEETEKLIQLGESVFQQVKPHLFDKTGEEFDDRIDLNESVSDEIRKKRQKITEIDNKKGDVIMKIIGQLYNGVLVKDKLSVRKGKVSLYRCQYKLGMERTKEIVMGNLHEVSTKLTPASLDILEFILNKIYTNPNTHIHNRYSSDNSNERQKIIRFPELKIIEEQEDRWNRNEGNETATKNLNIHFLNGVVIRENGQVQFFYEHKNKDGELMTDFPSLTTETFAGLYIKFEKGIEENANIFIQELDSEIEKAEKEMTEIRDKGQNQLALCELQNTGERR